MNKKELIVTDFDLLTTRGSTQIIKALIPYLSPSEQRTLAIIVRLMEFMQTISYFESQTAIWCPDSSQLQFTPEQIGQLKKYCTPELQKTLDMILQFMNISSVMNMVNFDSLNQDTPSPENIMQIFSKFSQGSHNDNGKSPMMSFFNNSQIDLYQQYMNELNQKFSKNQEQENEHGNQHRQNGTAS